jgi:hypothetical protein
VLVPLALAQAWWGGFEPTMTRTLVALAPVAAGGLAALAARQGKGKPVWSALRRIGSGAPAIAGGLFRLVTGIERRVIALADRLLRAASSPLHDLHTGDAQEYLLFLAGLAVLAMVAPLLQ